MAGPDASRGQAADVHLVPLRVARAPRGGDWQPYAHAHSAVGSPVMADLSLLPTIPPGGAGAPLRGIPPQERTLRALARGEREWLQR